MQPDANETGAIRKPRRRTAERLRSADLDAATESFPSPELKAYYFAHVIEAASCWPRVLAGVMTQDRFAERTKRMSAAILRASA